MHAIKQRVKVLSGGRIEIIAPELEEGSEAEVIVLTENGAQSTLDAEDAAADVRDYLAAKAEWEAEGRPTISMEEVFAEIERERTGEVNDSDASKASAERE